jgi:Type II secretion system (T2SS), protein K
VKHPPSRPVRSSVIVVVLVTLAFAAAALTAFIERASTDLLVDVHAADARRLRQEAFSALEVTLAVLEDFRQADQGLHSSAEGWNDPLGWAGYTPSEGRKVEVELKDESGKIPIGKADLTTLTNLFEAWELSPADASKLADDILGWMRPGYVYSNPSPPDYGAADLPYAEPERPLRSYAELSAIAGAKEFFFDENGLPNDYFWRFVDDVSLFTYAQPNANGANADVLAAEGQYTDAQRQHIGDYLQGKGSFANQGQQWFQNTGSLATIAGIGGNATSFGTTVTALRVTITVTQGSARYRMSAVVAPQSGATLNKTLATNPQAAAKSSAQTATSVTSSSQPSSTATSATAAAAASQSLNYPFTLLQLIENDEIPQPPPAVQNPT